MHKAIQRISRYRPSGFGADDGDAQLSLQQALISKSLGSSINWTSIDLAATTSETIRYYERIGLLPAPSRTAARYRIYGRSDVNRLAFVKRSRDLGFTIDEVRVLLALAREGDRDCKEVDAIARRHLTGVEGKIGDLQRLARELRHLIGQCRGGECRIIEALAPDTSRPL
jgi:DNA-binding transcriptional MerR regulator